MSFEIKLSNPYLCWEKQMSEGINYYYKGALFYNSELLTSDKLIHLFSSLNLVSEKGKFQKLPHFLNNLNGEYAFVIESPHQIICAVDRVRSIPLFYSMNDGHFIISDDAYYIKDKIKPDFNEENAAEFLVTGYVTGNETLFENINQIQAGEILIYNKEVNSLQTYFYFRFIHKDFMDLPEEELLSKLDACFVDVFKRLVDSTVNKGKQIVVPLSGGLDSRIIVAMLKRLGVENVICFSYGKESDREVKISKKVAEALGYKWYFVKYTHDKWYQAYHSQDMQLYQKYAGNLVSLPHIQDYLAVKVLKSEGKFPENSVFIPGHSGDMLAGSHIPLNYADSSHRYKKETFLMDSLRKHYNLWKWKDNIKINQIFKENISTSVENFEITDNESCANAIELFDFNERQAKFIVNSVRIYEFFGYEWRIPLWDAELIDYFRKVPLNYRIMQALYKNYTQQILFSENLASLSMIDCTTNFKKNTAHNKVFNLVSKIKSVNRNIYSRIRFSRGPLEDIFKPVCLDIKEFDDFPILNLILIHNHNSSVSTNGLLSFNYMCKNISKDSR